MNPKVIFAIVVGIVCLAVGIWAAVTYGGGSPPPPPPPGPTTPGPTTPGPTTPPAAWTSYPNTECYNSQYDISYQGVQTADNIKTRCAADPRCAGAVQHGGGDWWLLSGVHPNNGVGGSPGNQCIVAPGKSLV